MKQSEIILVSYDCLLLKMKNYGVICKDCSSDEYDTESENEEEKYNSDNSDIGGYISD